MTSRERLINSLEGRAIDRIPFLLQGEVVGYTPPFLRLFREKTGEDSPAEYFGFDVRGIYLAPTRLKTDFSRFLCSGPPAHKIDEWGVGITPGSMPHLVRMTHPMKNFTSTGELNEYPFPDLTADYRYEGLKEKIRSFHDRGLPVACFTGSIFEQSWYLRGMENLLSDFIISPTFAHDLLEWITVMLMEVSYRVSRLGVDVIIIGDDIAGQHGMSMSIAHYREFLKTRHARVVRAVKEANPATRVLYHSDGNIMDVIPELIETGIDILNPIQPECMNAAEVKRRFGGYLSFWGGFSLQKTLPFGTKDDIIAEIRYLVSTLGKGGRYVLAPAHVIGPDVPWENVVTFCETAAEISGQFR